MLPGIVAAIISASFYTLAFPPCELSFFAWITLVPLLLVLPHQTWKARLISGLVYGFGFALGVTNWAFASVQAYFGISRLAAALVVCSMYSIYVAGYVALFSLAAGRCLQSSSPVLKLTAIPSLWVIYEYARTHTFAGLPWEFIGHSQFRHLSLIQIADLTGELGVSFIVVTVNVAIAESLREAAQMWRSQRLVLSRLVEPAAVGLLAVVLPLSYGATRLRELEQDSQPIKIALVQANVRRPRSPSRVDSAKAILEYVRTTREHLDGQAPYLIVWPEYALDSYPETDPARLQALARVASKARAGLIFGAPRAEPKAAQHGFRIHNTAYFMRQDGQITGFYDKRRLLPFAEYTPAIARYLMPDRNQDIFAAGKSRLVIDTGSAGKAGVLICYEALFPRLARETVRQGADYLVNISNDGWLALHDSTAARQHFSMLTFRAIENRVFVARVATTGISGIIDPVGRPQGVLPAGAKGVSFGAVTKPVARPPVLLWGDWFPLVTGIWAMLALGLEAPRHWGTRHG